MAGRPLTRLEATESEERWNNQGDGIDTSLAAIEKWYSDVIKPQTDLIQKGLSDARDTDATDETWRLTEGLAILDTIPLTWESKLQSIKDVLDIIYIIL